MEYEPLFSHGVVRSLLVLLFVLASAVAVSAVTGRILLSDKKNIKPTELMPLKKSVDDFPNDGSIASAMMFASREEPSPQLSKELDIEYHDSATDSGGGGNVGGGD